MSFESSSKESLCSFVVPIATTRLELVAITPEAVLSEQTGDRRLGEILGCRVTTEWPPKDWEPHVLVWLLNRFAEDPTSVRWCRYMLLREEGALPVLIGTIGAVQEFGYGVLPEFQRRGFASEAAQAMVAWVREAGDVTELVAHTYPELVAHTYPGAVWVCGGWTRSRGADGAVSAAVLMDCQTPTEQDNRRS